MLLHGLSATRRNVVQGSRALLRRGYRLIAYDARGHGASSPAPSYTYPDLIEDLEAVLAELGVDRVALVGSSMGAATAMAFAMRHPDRAAAVVQVTPAYNGEARTGNVDDGAWDAMASGLEEGGVDAFVDVAQPGDAGEGWRQIAREAVRQRMERHEHPLEVAKALRQTPRSAAWNGLEALAGVQIAGADRGVPRRDGPPAPDGDRPRVRAAAAERRARGGGRGQVPARLAGSPPVGRDRGLLRARGVLIEFPVHIHHLPFEAAIPHERRRQGLLVVCGAMFISAVDMTIVNVALPAISEDLNASVGELQWVLDAFLVALAGLLLVGSGLADRFGRKRVFLAGMAGFGVASVLCSLAPSRSR